MKLKFKKIEVAQLGTIKGGDIDLTDINKPTNPMICFYANSFLPTDCNYISFDQ